MLSNLQFLKDLVTLTEEIFKGELNFLYSLCCGPTNTNFQIRLHKKLSFLLRISLVNVTKSTVSLIENFIYRAMLFELLALTLHCTKNEEILHGKLHFLCSVTCLLSLADNKQCFTRNLLN